MNINIITAQAADYDSIIALLKHVNLLTDDILVAGTRYWVAKTDAGKVAACMGMEFGEDAALIRSLAVYEVYQGERLALRLIENAVEEAKTAGYHHIYCFSTRAADYFQRVGFRPVPVAQLVKALPNVPQVVRFDKIGKLAGERAFHKALM
ncbi:MAG: GNAT family N-acetyltransferase [Anaerolineaceae bacterium]|nr:GNAT family N-acetyltransferase [Anaerolineaceae bacterium]